MCIFGFVCSRRKYKMTDITFKGLTYSFLLYWSKFLSTEVRFRC